MKKIRTIFEMLGKECEEESCVDFDDMIRDNGAWESTCLDSDDNDNNIFISEDKKYKYYLGVDDDSCMTGTIIFRVKKGDC